MLCYVQYNMDQMTIISDLSKLGKAVSTDLGWNVLDRDVKADGTCKMKHERLSF